MLRYVAAEFKGLRATTRTYTVHVHTCIYIHMYTCLLSTAGVDEIITENEELTAAK